MVANRIYYAVKPFIPRGFRLALRSWWTRRKLADTAATWPIQESAAQPPTGWKGWPEGKQFAFVLSHDVEGCTGLERVRPLAALEKSLGFRSSFNFIPEGDYQTSRELRDYLGGEGFEVGVHDLQHDGKLFRSRTEFADKARRINEYLRDWKALGFRSGFMLHNLSWLGDLEIKYDASTFDTDPFEPQPDGAGTIFPFWVPRAKGGTGYMELPYSIPQDSTVFTLLKEKSIAIWKRKLDWVAKKGGMALVNVHPDYTAFNGKLGTGEFPADYYKELLEYVKSRYAGAYWHALPREVAEYCEESRPRRNPRPAKRICMLAYTFYASDNRVRRYTESLARRGDQVDVVTLRKEEGAVSSRASENITVYGLQKRVHNEKAKLTYLYRLARFCIVSGIFLAREHSKKPYDLVHVHNVPDFLVFGALVPKLKGAKVILDIHDVVPEFYSSKFAVDQNSPIINLLKYIEKKSMRFADHVIISNHLWYDKVTARSVPAEQCSPFVNNVDPRHFYLRPRTRKDGKFIILFPGGMQWHQGLDIAIRAFGLIRDKAPEAEFHIYGEGNAKPQLQELVRELGLEKRVFIFPARPLDEITGIMANADMGVVPKRANSFGNEAYSTKIMEFMSQGVPMVVSRTKIDMFYFNDKIVRFFESENVEDLADAMLTLIRNQPMREALAKNALVYAEENSWGRRESDYFNIVDSLTY